MTKQHDRQHPRPRPRRTRRLRASRELARWRALLGAYGAEEMTHEEIGELRRLTAIVGGRPAVRALGLT